MSWYDYIPVVSNVAGIVKGDPLQALGGPLGYTFGNKIRGANQEARQGYYDAADQLKQFGQEQRDFQMQGLDRSLGFYDPARQRLRNMYGDPGMMRK